MDLTVQMQEAAPRLWARPLGFQYLMVFDAQLLTIHY